MDLRAEQAGLAPHYDDVELFVCHTEGRKLWRVYKPEGRFELPSRPSSDLQPADLGQPVLETVLEPGHLLYLPRGTVHAAEAVGEEGSCHVTISTYQTWTLATLLQVHPLFMLLLTINAHQSTLPLVSVEIHAGCAAPACDRGAGAV